MTSRDTKCGKLNINKKSSALAFFLLFLFCGGFFGGCGVLRRHEAVTGTLEDAIEIAVDNFLTCRLSDNSDWFKVIPYWNYHDQRDYYNEDGLIEFFIMEQDTVVYLSAFSEQPDDWFNADEAIYRGLLSIDSLPVAIYERNRCGANLYDSTKLVYVPLHNLKKLPKYSIIARWGVQGDSLILDILP